MRRSLRLFGVALLALLVGACTSTSARSGTDANPVTVSPPAPTINELSIEQPSWGWKPSGWSLHLSWDPSDAAAIDHYAVSRNGEIVAERVLEPAWLDRDVEPSSRYRYSVVGTTTDGQRTQREGLSIRTGTPGLEQARLQGSFVMGLRVERASGTSGTVDGGRVVFRFRPRCARGPCSARWTVQDRLTRMAVLRSGSSYSGRARTPLLIRNCFGDSAPEMVRARFEVVDAAAIHGRWVATKIRGTIDERSRWPGCMAASIRWAVRGMVT